MKKILTYGTFDMFHIGHLNLLKRAKELGDFLVVGISSDDFNNLKNKKTLIPFEERRSILDAIKYVNTTIKEDSWNQKIIDIQKYDINIFVMGDDWKGKFDYLEEYCEVIYLPRTENISTTELKENLKSFFNIDIDGLKQATNTINSILKALE